MSAYFFETVTKSYTAVPTADGVSIPEFLEATENLIRLFDILGSTAFSPIKSDMTGNVTKIRNRYNTNKEKYSTLQKMIKGELEDKTSNLTATEGLLWLKRALEFCAYGLRNNLDNPGVELKDSFSQAYEKSLKEFHSILVRPIFSLAMKAVPKRADFYAKLGPDMQTVLKELIPWLQALEEIIKTLVKYYEEIGMNKSIKK